MPAQSVRWKRGEWNGLEGRRRRRSVGREKRPLLDLLTGWYGHDRREEWRLGAISKGRGEKKKKSTTLTAFLRLFPATTTTTQEIFFVFNSASSPFSRVRPSASGFYRSWEIRKRKGFFLLLLSHGLGGGKRGQRLAGLTKREKEGANGLHPPFLAGGGGRVEEEQEEVEEEEEEAISEPGNDKQITPLPLFLPRFLPRFISPCRKLVGPLLPRRRALLSEKK